MTGPLVRTLVGVRIPPLEIDMPIFALVAGLALLYFWLIGHWFARVLTARYRQRGTRIG